MTDRFYVIADSTKPFDSYESAEEKAKRSVAANSYGNDYYVLKAVAVARAPTPAVEVTKL